jgi:hypothetical protein
LYKEDDLARGAQLVSYVLDNGSRAGGDGRDDGPVIFGAISLVLASVALWATGAAYVDLAAVMF